MSYVFMALVVAALGVWLSVFSAIEVRTGRARPNLLRRLGVPAWLDPPTDPVAAFWIGVVFIVGGIWGAVATLLSWV